VFGKRPLPGSSAVAEIEDRQPVPARAPQPPAPAAGAAASPPVPGGRTPFPSAGLGAPILSAPAAGKIASPAQNPAQIAPAIDSRRSDSYYETKGAIFGALIEAIDLGQLAKLDADSARE
jgi:pilus assembly protein CpaF